MLGSELAAKRLDLIHQLLPSAAVLALLINPSNPYSEAETGAVQNVAQSLKLKLHVLQASTANEIDTAFRNLVELRASALVVGLDPFLTSQSERIAALAGRHRVPAIYGWREIIAAGGLMSYAPDLADGYRVVGIYAGRILKGEKPADLPVQQVAKVQLVINLKTAKALGLEVPPTLLIRADEVIE